jgi:putative transposase
MAFELFDPSQDLRITFGNLPHWYQPGVTYFVTFRTHDSIPPDVADLWYRQRDDWLQRHGIDVLKTRWKLDVANLSQSQQQEFHTRFSNEYQSYLDQGYGECVLRHYEVAEYLYYRAPCRDK